MTPALSRPPPSADLGMGRDKPTEKNICILRGPALGGGGKFPENRGMARQIKLSLSFPLLGIVFNYLLLLATILSKFHFPHWTSGDLHGSLHFLEAMNNLFYDYLVYWLALLIIGISNMIISELMHLAPFQGTHGRTAGMRGWRLMHPVSSEERVHSWNNFWSFVDICKSWVSYTFPVFLFPFILRS